MSITAALATTLGPDDGREFRFLESCHTYLLIVARQEMGARFVGPKSASDFVQESILAAVEAEGQGFGAKLVEDDRRRWLGGIVRNKIKAAIRHEVIHPRDHDEAPDPSDHGPRPLDRIIEGEVAERLFAALDRLTPEDRQLVVWSVEEVKRCEMGERLGVAASYASRVCNRALERFRLAYDEGGERRGE